MGLGLGLQWGREWGYNGVGLGLGLGLQWGGIGVQVVMEMKIGM